MQRTEQAARLRRQAELLEQLDKLGRKRENALADADKALASIAALSRKSIAVGLPKLQIARAARISRPTLDRVLEEGG